jgi:hypothetical protein
MFELGIVFFYKSVVRISGILSLIHKCIFVLLSVPCAVKKG